MLLLKQNFIQQMEMDIYFVKFLTLVNICQEHVFAIMVTLYGEITGHILQLQRSHNIKSARNGLIIIWKIRAEWHLHFIWTDICLPC